VRGAAKDVGGGGLKAETHVGERRGDHDDPHDFDYAYVRN
jgi:hypothetical protein